MLISRKRGGKGAVTAEVHSASGLFFYKAMSISKGNELLQELYARLTGLWEKTGKYAGQPFSSKDVKALIEQILEEYKDNGCQG